MHCWQDWTMLLIIDISSTYCSTLQYKYNTKHNTCPSCIVLQYITARLVHTCLIHFANDKSNKDQCTSYMAVIWHTNQLFVIFSIGRYTVYRKSRDLEMLNVLLKFFHSNNFSGKKFMFPENWGQPTHFAYNYLQ